MASLHKKTLLLLICLIAIGGLAFGRDHSRDFGELRDVVDRTQTDLKMASGLEHGDKQRGRVQHAEDDLSKLDRKLVKGKMDKEAFSHSLSALKSILDHNTLPGSGRDALMRDLSELQAQRDRH
jgi:hypothetical protein